VEHLVGARAGQADDRRAEVAERGELAERPRRAEVGDARRRLPRAACRHDLAPDRRDALDRQGARIGLLQRVDDRRLALGSERGRALGALQRADRRCDFGATVEQAEQLAVQGIEAPAQRFEFGVPGGVWAAMRATCSRTAPAPGRPPEERPG
jgi:hypothetical protein